MKDTEKYNLPQKLLTFEEKYTSVSIKMVVKSKKDIAYMEQNTATFLIEVVTWTL